MYLPGPYSGDKRSQFGLNRMHVDIKESRAADMDCSVQPLIARGGLTLWAMPVATRVEKCGLVRTGIALFEARTKGGGTTGTDVSECFALSSRQGVSPAGEERLSVLAEDIGHF